jgi:DNA-binding transcriptional ArsR family regulator
MSNGEDGGVIVGHRPVRIESKCGGRSHSAFLVLTSINLAFNLVITKTKIMGNEQKLALMFKVLAVPARVTIVQLLKHQALCVGALAARLGITPGAVSQHLGILKEAGLVKAEKRGYFMHYGLNVETLARWKEAMEEFLTAPEELKPSEPCNLLKPGGGLCVPVKPGAKNRKS